jgi:hypothetical protein
MTAKVARMSVIYEVGKRESGEGSLEEEAIRRTRSGLRKGEWCTRVAHHCGSSLASDDESRARPVRMRHLTSG